MVTALNTGLIGANTRARPINTKYLFIYITFISFILIISYHIIGHLSNPQQLYTMNTMSLLDTFKRLLGQSPAGNLFGFAQPTPTPGFNEAPTPGGDIIKVWDSDQQAYKYVRKSQWQTDRDSVLSAEVTATPTPSKIPLISGVPEQFRQAILDAADKHHIDPNILAALLKTESNFNVKAKSHVGAQGIAQFMPDTAKELGIDPNDPVQAIDGAARYLRKHLDDFGDVRKALAAYNAGAGNVRKYKGVPPFKETQDYVDKVLKGSTLSPTP